MGYIGETLNPARFLPTYRPRADVAAEGWSDEVPPVYDHETSAGTGAAQHRRTVALLLPRNAQHEQREGGGSDGGRE